MLKYVNTGLVLAVVSLTTGCASIVSGHNQSLSVETRSKSELVKGATCTLNNNKGTWYVTTPGSVTVHRSIEDLAVKCEKDGSDVGLASIKSSTKAMAFGNLIFGGIIGGGVDVATGAAYDYPSLITVMMGETGVIAPVAASTATETKKD